MPWFWGRFPLVFAVTTPPSEALIEAVALAICAAHMLPGPWTQLSDEGRESYRATARAAIAAHTKALAEAGLVVVPREPTPEMLHAATMQVPTWDDEASRRKWHAMVSAALRHAAEGGEG